MEKYFLCIDLGGTTCKFGLFNNNEKLLYKWKISSKVEGNNKQKILLENIVSSINAFLDKKNINIKNIKYISIAVPGIVKNRQIINEIINIDFNKKIDISRFFKSKFGNHIKVVAENDANLAALGEYKYGAGKNKNPFCHVIVGTGMGLGIIIDGKILTGYNYTAGEFGHLLVAKDMNIKCNCNEIGCLETVASGTGITNMYYKLSKENKKNIKHNIDTEYIIKEVKNNNKFAIKVFDKSMAYFAQGINELAKILNPELISIGGGVSNAGKIVLKYLNKNLDIYMNSKIIHKPKITIAKLKNDAGIYGALALAKGD